MLFETFLRKLIGQIILIETHDGTVLFGKIMSVDENATIHLSAIRVIIGSQHPWIVETFTIRGIDIRFGILKKTAVVLRVLAELRAERDAIARRLDGEVLQETHGVERRW